MRPTYTMLLRHAWLAPLMKPPTISENGEVQAAAENGGGARCCEEINTHSETADKEVAEWVRSALERKAGGKMAKMDKPALHAVPLDAVPGSPLLDRDGLKLHTSPTTTPNQCRSGVDAGDQAATAAASIAAAAAAPEPEPRDGVTSESPVLQVQKVDSMDFADGFSHSSRPDENGRERESEARAPRIKSESAEGGGDDGG